MTPISFNWALQSSSEQIALLFADDTASLLELTGLPWGVCFLYVKFIHPPPSSLRAGDGVSPKLYSSGPRRKLAVVGVDATVLDHLPPFFLKAVPCARSLRFLKGKWWVMKFKHTVRSFH